MSLKELRTEAENRLKSLVKVTDQENRWKIRDEMLAFRRRMRLYCGANNPVLYEAHMKDSIRRLPDYRDWFAAEGYPDAAEECEKLQACLSSMLEATP